VAGDPPKPFHRVVPDHVLLHGRLASGGALAVQVAGGRPPADTPFRMDVTGEDGILTLEGGAARGFQAGLLRLRLNGEPADATDGETAGLPAPVVNVARVYAALRNDIAGGTSTTPDFGHAVRLSHLIDDIRTAATTGQTITPTADWP
jgi:predicted dehydrogenase